MKCCICAIAKNENDYINEWCKYHLNLGFDKIFIFDNNEKTTEYVGNRIDRSISEHITIIPANDCTYGFQVKVYSQFYDKFNKEFDWLAFLDIDEFIVLNKHKSIKDLLSTINSDIPVLRLNWQMYGDDGILSGDIKVPVYKRIVKKLNHRYNLHGKCLVRGNVEGVVFKSSHYPMINGQVGKSCFPSGRLLGPEAKVNIGAIEYSIAYIAHYMTKTWEEFKKQKLNRTDAGFNRRLSIEYFKEINPNTKIDI
jgi:hypothetical protein